MSFRCWYSQSSQVSWASSWQPAMLRSAEVLVIQGSVQDEILDSYRVTGGPFSGGSLLRKETPLLYLSPVMIHNLVLLVLFLILLLWKSYQYCFTIATLGFLPRPGSLAPFCILGLYFFNHCSRLRFFSGRSQEYSSLGFSPVSKM